MTVATFACRALTVAAVLGIPSVAVSQNISNVSVRVDPSVASPKATLTVKSAPTGEPSADYRQVASLTLGNPTATLGLSNQPETDTGIGTANGRSIALLPGPTLEPVPVPVPIPKSVPSSLANSVANATAQTVGPQPIRLPGGGSNGSSTALQTILVEAMNQLDPTRIPRLDKATEDLKLAIEQLEHYYGAKSERGLAWNKFLHLERLRSELEKGQPDVDVLIDLLTNMRQNYLGLEYSPFVRVRDKLNNVIRAARYGYQPEKTVETLNVKLQQLCEQLNEPPQGADTERSYAVGLLANYLHETNQVPNVVSRIHGQFSTPNFQVIATEKLINRLVQRPVREPSAVNECLLGTRIIGQAWLTGAVNVDLLPMSNGVAMRLNLSGNMQTVSNGYNRGVVIGSTASSPVFASKQISITDNGISLAPASVSTRLSTSINSYQHPRRIVRRIAKKKAAQQKPLADSIAEGRLQNRIRNQYDSQVEQQVADLRVRLTEFRKQPLPELERLGIQRPQLRLVSTDSAIQGSVVQASGFQLAASAPCPLSSPSSDILIQAHQSAFMNGLDLLLGDRTIRNFDLDDYARQAVALVPKALQDEADGEPWSITLAAYRPVELEFDDGLINIKLRIAKMTRGDQSLADPAFVTASYRPVYQDQVLRLDRRGPVEVDFPRASRGLRAVTLRSFLKNKFDAFFKEQFATQPINLASLFPNAALLNLNAIQVDEGWLQVGLR